MIEVIQNLLMNNNKYKYKLYNFIFIKITQYNIIICLKKI